MLMLLLSISLQAKIQTDMIGLVMRINVTDWQNNLEIKG